MKIFGKPFMVTGAGEYLCESCRTVFSRREAIEHARGSCAGRIEGNVAVRATLTEIQALGPDRAKAFLQGIAKVIGANKQSR